MIICSYNCSIYVLIHISVSSVFLLIWLWARCIYNSRSVACYLFIYSVFHVFRCYLPLNHRLDPKPGTSHILLFTYSHTSNTDRTHVKSRKHHQHDCGSLGNNSLVFTPYSGCAYDPSLPFVCCAALDKERKHPSLGPFRRRLLYVLSLSLEWSMQSFDIVSLKWNDFMVYNTRLIIQNDY